MDKKLLKADAISLAHLRDCEEYQAPIIEVVEVRNEQNILGGSNPTGTAPYFGDGGDWGH